MPHAPSRRWLPVGVILAALAACAGTTEPAGPAARAGAEATVTVTGVLTDEGIECPALRADDGAIYTLAGDARGFGPGDRVRVTGTVAEMSFCMQGTTLAVAGIEAAP